MPIYIEKVWYMYAQGSQQGRTRISIQCNRTEAMFFLVASEREKVVFTDMSTRMGTGEDGMPTANGFGWRVPVVPPCGATERTPGPHDAIITMHCRDVAASRKA